MANSQNLLGIVLLVLPMKTPYWVC